MFDNLKNMMSLLGNAKQIKERMAQLQDELSKRVVEGESGAGAVRVRVSGKFEVLEVKLDPAMLATLTGDDGGGDLQMIEDLIASALNVAMARARDMVQQEIQSATGGLKLPGMG
jgi:DNA-binding YbaB/EbfC family protein